MEELEKNIQNKAELRKINALVNKHTCNFIATKFLNPCKKNGKAISQNEYSENCGIASSTISKIKRPNGYEIPYSMIYTICRFEKYTMTRFFTEFELEYGTDIRP